MEEAQDAWVKMARDQPGEMFKKHYRTDRGKLDEEFGTEEETPESVHTQH